MPTTTIVEVHLLDGELIGRATGPSSKISREELRERALRQATDNLIAKASGPYAGSGEIKVSWREEED